MQRASLDGMADGWKKGFLRGRRSEKVLLLISVSFKPKMSFSSVIMPIKVLSGCFRLTLACGVCCEDLATEADFQVHSVDVLVGVVFYAVNAYYEGFAGFKYACEVDCGSDFGDVFVVCV